MLCSSVAILSILSQGGFFTDPGKGILDDFESGSFREWKLTGSFGRANLPTNVPEFNRLHKETPIGKCEGRFCALSFARSNSETGKAVSPSFTIPPDWSQITFDILGGSDQTKTVFRLVDDKTGLTVRNSCGDGTLTFTRKFWNVGDLRGKAFHLEIEDADTGHFGFIGLDNIRGNTEKQALSSHNLRLDFTKLSLQQPVLAAAESWRAKYHLPGVWCAVIKDSQVVACLAVGINNPETGDRPRLDHHLNIGSVSKVLTAMLISQFVARDVISYDTKISDVFPSIALKYPNSPFRTATLRQLIAHTSGITKAVRFDTSDTADGKSWRLKHVEYALASNQTVPPNTSYEYSNAGPVIATAMVEQMLSQSPLKEELGPSYEDWLAGIPGKALGLTNPKMLNYAVPPSAEEVQPNYILDSGFRANHKLGKESFQYAPQGSCSITLTDLCRFSVVMMTNGMQLPQHQYRSAFSELVSQSKNTTGGWGLGINSKFVDHNGDTGRGEYAYLRLHPIRKLSIIFYTNGNIENRDQSRVFRGEITSEIAKLLDRL